MNGSDNSYIKLWSLGYISSETVSNKQKQRQVEASEQFK